ATRRSKDGRRAPVPPPSPCPGRGRTSTYRWGAEWFENSGRVPTSGGWDSSDTPRQRCWRRAGGCTRRSSPAEEFRAEELESPECSAPVEKQTRPPECAGGRAG